MFKLIKIYIETFLRADAVIIMKYNLANFPWIASEVRESIQKYLWILPFYHQSTEKRGNETQIDNFSLLQFLWWVIEKLM